MNEVFMRRIFPIVLVLGLLPAPLLFAQEQETPLGDIARALRKSKKAAEQTVVDNEISPRSWMRPRAGGPKAR